MVLHYDTEPNLFRVQVALEVTKFRERIAKYVAFFRRGAKLCIRMYEYVLAGTFVSTFALRFELRCTVLTHDFAGAFVRAKIISQCDWSTRLVLASELGDTSQRSKSSARPDRNTVSLKMAQVERAVERGRGPSELKDSFFVEDIARTRTPTTSTDHMIGHADYNIESTWS